MYLYVVIGVGSQWIRKTINCLAKTNGAVLVSINIYLDNIYEGAFIRRGDRIQWIYLTITY